MRPGVGQRRDFPGPGTFGLLGKRKDHLRGHKRRSLAGGNSVLRRSRSLMWPLRSPTAFHCIPLFHFSIWGLPHWSVSVEGALRPGLWEPFRAFTVDLLRFGQSEGEVGDFLTEREKQERRRCVHSFKCLFF